MVPGTCYRSVGVNLWFLGSVAGVWCGSWDGYRQVDVNLWFLGPVTGLWCSSSDLLQAGRC